ncbi:hypothetical protein HanXRQr2_Chr11g0508061 [Helianthus annuus]|uniref:Uncharacterized protein n=1 Tax=Helianthus annuus TaxID=4232 RepID=A0A251TC34_HELAN|nr:hypothetical protein HanXRQr2_Chr11g0508061 [Helianthus annuus]KAJ0502769.1 hypothetical protein HanHA300_Chr11g0416691 [Helianthus annuus]KAJ0518729.1 hypothetical protein HanHA89_Chr11g0440721 [Helianthus annuus]
MDQDPYRNVDSVSSKWRKMNSSINRFCEEYKKLYTVTVVVGGTTTMCSKKRWTSIRKRIVIPTFLMFARGWL